jgi:Spy/CpxP family protein refolding chaperone
LLFSASAASQPYGMGPGMMGDPGYGMGRGMMGQGMMMGPGMGSYGYGLTDLTGDQKKKLTELQVEFRRKQWTLMQSMHEIAWRQNDVYGEGKVDEEAARKSFDAMTALHKQMFENTLDLRKRSDAVLTPQQRDQLSRRLSGR